MEITTPTIDGLKNLGMVCQACHFTAAEDMFFQTCHTVSKEGQVEAVQADSQRAPQEPQPVGAFLAANEGTRLFFLPSDPESFELKHADVEGLPEPSG